MTDVVVLCYHAVSDTWPEGLAVTQRDLREQLGTLVRNGFRGATFTQAMLDPPAKRTLAVTFDDAYSSVGELAQPILADLGLPGTVFAVSDFGDGSRLLRWPGIEQVLGGPHEHELRCMDWDRLAGLAGAGWEIGSHTCTHPRLTELDDAALDRELRDSRLACEDALRRPCRSLAYPYGNVDARVVAATRAAGYDAAAGLPSRPSGSDRLDWPRLGIYRRDTPSRFRLKTAVVPRRLRHVLWTVSSATGR